MTDRDTAVAGRGPGGSPKRDGAEPEPTSARRGPVCPVAFCPIGLALTTVQQAGPEVVDHLLAAAGEFLLAARAVIDQRADGFEPRGSTPLEKIEVG